MSQTEDIPYNVSDFATPEKETQPDEDQPNKSVLIEVSKFLGDCIKEDKLTTSLDLSKDAPLSLEQQVFISKRDNVRLRNAKMFIDNKIKELR